MSLDDGMQAKLGSYETEIENGIFNLVVSLCKKKAERLDMDEAKAEVQNYLQSLIDGLLD